MIDDARLEEIVREAMTVGVWLPDERGRAAHLAKRVARRAVEVALVDAMEIVRQHVSSNRDYTRTLVELRALAEKFK